MCHRQIWQILLRRDRVLKRAFFMMIIPDSQVSEF
jgi:hypothetical protein